MPLTGRRVSAVVACYNDAGSVLEMYRRLGRSLEEVTSDYEIIYVNDGSPDESREILRGLAEADDRVSVVTHSRNFGSQMAFTSGMELATGQAVALLDGDLQDPPELLVEFARRWLEGFDVVYGVRVRRQGERLLRQWGYRLFYRLFRRLADVPVPVDVGDYSLIDRRVVDLLVAMPERDRFLRGLRAWVGFRQVGVPYERAARYSGATTNSWLGNFRWARRGITNFSSKPLEYVTYLALLVSALASVAIGAYVVSYFLLPEAPRGFLTLLVAVLFLGAIQLLALAVLGDYLGRVFEEVKQRPRFIVEEILNDPRRRVEAQPMGGEARQDVR